MSAYFSSSSDVPVGPITDSWWYRSGNSGFYDGIAGANTMLHYPEEPAISVPNSSYDAKITLRELIFSVTIAAILFVIGFIISGCIEHNVNKEIMQYRQALQINDGETDVFREAILTDAGPMLVEGDIEAVKPVTDEHLSGEYLAIERRYEEYHMHTQVYTTTDSKGNSHVHTRTYWSWDTKGRTLHHAPHVYFNGLAFPYDKFDIKGCNWKNAGIHKIAHDKRYVYQVQQKKFHGTAFCVSNDGKIDSMHNPFYNGWTLEKTYKHLTNSYATTIFWWLWSFFIIAVVIGFVYLDNNWIED